MPARIPEHQRLSIAATSGPAEQVAALFNVSPRYVRRLRQPAPRPIATLWQSVQQRADIAERLLPADETQALFEKALAGHYRDTRGGAA